MSEVRKWLEAIGLTQYVDAFEANYSIVRERCEAERRPLRRFSREWSDSLVSICTMLLHSRQGVRCAGCGSAFGSLALLNFGIAPSRTGMSSSSEIFS
jgi:hypothetical protein